jgi:hypothetical protein
MSELDVKIVKLYGTNPIVNAAFNSSANELEALKLAVVNLAENYEIAMDALKVPASFTWEVTGNLVICSNCAKIREADE